jgi:hypothetical protein
MLSGGRKGVVTIHYDFLSGLRAVEISPGCPSIGGSRVGYGLIAPRPFAGE